MGNENSSGRFTDSSEEMDEYAERERERALRDSDESDDFSGSEDLRKPSWERQTTEKRFKYEDKNVDERESDYTVLSYELEETRLKIRYCHWTIRGFEGTDVVEKKNGSIKSDLYVSGPCNTFQFYFTMHRQITEDDTQYGLYVCELNTVRSNSKTYYQSLILDHRVRKTTLDERDAVCPEKPGLHFLGYLSKAKIIDDDYYNACYLGEGDLELQFKIDVEYNTSYIEEIRNLQTLLNQSQVKDVILNVAGRKFPANKNILSIESDVFEKLFEESKGEKIEITDIEPEVMESLLHYLHTRIVPKLLTHADKIAAAAHKYNLKDIIVMCKKAQLQ